MSRRLALSACIALGLAPAAQAAQFNFCWQGAGGYTMTGVIGFPDAALSKSVVTERDVTRFEITGYENLIAVGRWTLNDRKAGSTFHVRFDPRTLTFPTGGSFPGDYSQGWNAGGEVTDCGAKGFGFNSGNYAQDICLYGVWMDRSSIHPDTPMTVTTGPVSPDCRGIDALS